MIRNIMKATSCTLAILLFSPAHAAILISPPGANYTTVDNGSGYGFTNIEVTISSNDAFTLDFDNYGTFEELINITLVNNTGSDWASFSINYDNPFIFDTFNATLSVLATGSGNTAVINTVFTDPTYGLATGFAADIIGGEPGMIAIGGGIADYFYGLDTLMPLTITTSAVPVPAAVWLFGSGLLGLIGIARRKKA